MLVIPGQDEPFAHTDRNTLTRVAPPPPIRWPADRPVRSAQGVGAARYHGPPRPVVPGRTDGRRTRDAASGVEPKDAAMPPTLDRARSHGVRVLDLSSVIMGPLATQILGDLGRRRDHRRGPEGHAQPGHDRRARCHQLSGLALNLLRNKRNVVLDLKDPDGPPAAARHRRHRRRGGDQPAARHPRPPAAHLRRRRRGPPGHRVLPGPGLPVGLPRRRRPRLRRRDPGRLGHSRHVPAPGRRAGARARPWWPTRSAA